MKYTKELIANKIHKIFGIVCSLQTMGVFGFLFYGLYVMWTQGNRDVSPLELNLLLTYLSVLVFNFSIYVITD